MRLGAVSGNDWFHESPIKIIVRVAWSATQTGGAVSQAWPDKRQPEITGHPHFRPQSRGRTAWVHLQKIFYVIFNDVGELFDF